MKRISAGKEWRLLTRQCLLILWSDKKNLAVMMLFPVIAALITVWIAGENMFLHYDGTKSACFVLVSSAIWGGLFNSIQSVVKERSNIKRDYVTGLRLHCYSLSRISVHFGLCMLQSAILCFSFPMVSWIHENSLPEQGIVFESVMLEYYISIFLLMYAADILGFMLSCFVKKTETANVLAPYILIAQLIFSGILFSMKGAAEYFSYFMISRWGMEALGSTSRLNEMQLKIQMTVPTVPHKAETMYEATAEHLLQVWGIYFIFIVGFAVLGTIFLRSVSKDSR